ncbi:hypothetical protein Syun_027412 [Stephania yunnanensis]|uniref:Uncharacterized protein n=1 Tax=Stephania yunnanensis TaxID=152371 RepID=A0AAP0EFM5_9MAGN
MLDYSATLLHQCLTVPLLHYPIFTLTGHDQCSIRGEVWGRKKSSRNSPAIAFVFIFNYCKVKGGFTSSAEMDDSSNHNSQGPSIAVSDAAYDEYLVSSMTQKLTHTSVLPANSKRCIYRVPDNLKTQNESSYIPQIVSIGPFHHGSANLQAMQDQKWIYLKSLLARPHSSSTGEDASSHRLIMKKSQGRGVVDVGLLSYLAWDMILLENQLPLFVLEHLVSFNQLHRIDNITSQEPSSFLKELALEFFKHRLPLPKTYFDCHVDQLQHLENGSHHLLDLLDLLRNFLLIPSRSSTSDHVTIDIVKEQQEQMERSFIPSAKDLSFAGIRIKKAMDDNPLNVNFKYDRPELEILTMSIVENLSNPLLPNLVAFEQCHSNCSTQFTSYVWFLLNIIRDDDGVKFLYKQGIIKQLPGCEEDLVLFLKKICSGVTVPRNFYFSDLYDQLNMHFGRANLRRMFIMMKADYFDNPRTIMMVYNAVLVLILALVQTVFTVFTYLNDH